MRMIYFKCVNLSNLTVFDFHLLIYVTAPSERVTNKITHTLVNVNIVQKITTVYGWEGNINEDSEVLIIILK